MWFLSNGDFYYLFFLIHFHCRFKTLSISFTHHHRESGLFVCVSLKLELTQTHRVTPLLCIHPLLIPSSFSGLDLQVALTVTNAIIISNYNVGAIHIFSSDEKNIAAMKSICFMLQVLLLIAALLILFGELWFMATERAQYLCQCRHWFQLILALLSLATAILQLCFLSQATSYVSKVRNQNRKLWRVITISFSLSDTWHW